MVLKGEHLLLGRLSEVVPGSGGPVGGPGVLSNLQPSGSGIRTGRGRRAVSALSQRGAGPLWDSRLRGVCLGFSSATGKKDLLRAILEGTAYALRTILEEFPSDQKQSDVILGTGGGYNSALWSQIKADVLGRTICARKTTFDAAVLGSAYVAMEAAGVPAPKPPRDAEEILYRPDPALGSVYGRHYRRFQKAYQATRVLFHEEDEP